MATKVSSNIVYQEIIQEQNQTYIELKDAPELYQKISSDVFYDTINVMNNIINKTLGLQLDLNNYLNKFEVKPQTPETLIALVHFFLAQLSKTTVSKQFVSNILDKSSENAVLAFNKALKVKTQTLNKQIQLTLTQIKQRANQLQADEIKNLLEKNQKIQTDIETNIRIQNITEIFQDYGKKINEQKKQMEEESDYCKNLISELKKEIQKQQENKYIDIYTIVEKANKELVQQSQLLKQMHEKQIKQLEQQLEEQENIIKQEYEQQISVLKSLNEKTTLEQTIEIQNKLIKANQKIDELNQTITKLESMQKKTDEKAIQEAKLLKEQLKELNNQIQKLKDQENLIAQQHQKEIQAIQEEKSNVNLELQQKQEVIKILQKDLETKQKIYEENQLKLNEDIKEKQQTISKLEQQIEQIQDQLSQSQLLIENQETEQNLKINEIKIQNQVEIQNKLKEFEKLKDQLQEENNKNLQFQQEQIRTGQVEIENLKKLIRINEEQFKKDLNTKNDEIQRLNDLILINKREFEQKLQSLKIEQQESTILIQKEKTRIQEELSQQELKQKNLQIQNDNLQTVIINYKETVQKLQTEIQNLQQDLERKQDLEENNQQLLQDMKTLQEQLQQLKNSKFDFQKLVNLENENKVLKESVLKLNSKIDQLQTDEQINEMVEEEQSSAFKARIQLGEILENVVQRINNNQSLQVQFQNKTSQLSGEFKDITDTLAKIFDSYDQNSKELKNLNTKLAANLNKIEIFNSQIELLKAQNQQLSDQIEYYKIRDQDYIKIQNEMLVKNKIVENMEININQLNQQLQKDENEKLNLIKQIQVLQDKLVTLENENQFEMDIDLIKTKFESLILQSQIRNNLTLDTQLVQFLQLMKKTIEVQLSKNPDTVPDLVRQAHKKILNQLTTQERSFQDVADIYEDFVGLPQFYRDFVKKTYSDKIEDLSQEIVQKQNLALEYQQQLEQSMTIRNDLESQLKSQNRIIQNIAIEKSDLQQRLKNESQLLNDLKSKIDKYEIKITALNERLKINNQLIDEEKQQYTKDINKLKTQILSQKAQINILDEREQQFNLLNQQLRTQISSQQKEIDQLKVELDVKNKILNKNQNDLLLLSNQLQQEKQINLVSQTKAEGLANQITAKNVQINDFEKQVKDLKEQLKKKQVKTIDIGVSTFDKSLSLQNIATQTQNNFVETQSSEELQTLKNQLNLSLTKRLIDDYDQLLNDEDIKETLYQINSLTLINAIKKFLKNFVVTVEPINLLKERFKNEFLLPIVNLSNTVLFKSFTNQQQKQEQQDQGEQDDQNNDDYIEDGDQQEIDDQDNENNQDIENNDQQDDEINQNNDQQEEQGNNQPNDVNQSILSQEEIDQLSQSISQSQLDDTLPEIPQLIDKNINLCEALKQILLQIKKMRQNQRTKIIYNHIKLIKNYVCQQESLKKLIKKQNFSVDI